ncbi:phosphate acetyltransferase [Legionella qingyii]|uniref:Phosphate acetyltransferase n=1 Tax=Legionella qingyii TaxID=2184757 RepID=A0A317U759_9GAMM|nr:bifunctional enoyl-CoA hydratase/phosphate acetyltransferase [Legionella qingyii]PWY56706.1 phosphate acetyltransferase [Legionella qingyii]RUR23739.1 bifunctional enoyl-CoA hydratase/phosphate acetyltransferase [Legionella qingyii]RUR26321.1 bifunctional enoyl-CoA hydratase/phosphate acetyltransferase [Legionella qingyii]
MDHKRLDLDKLAKNFLQKCQALPKIKVAVVFPCSEDSLEGAIEANHLGLIDPVFIGPKSKIQDIAKSIKADIGDYELIDIAESQVAAEKAVQLARERKVAALMKGSLHTDELMHAVIKKENGLRTRRRISHAFIMAIEKYHKPFIVTDAAINIAPDLMVKKDIIQNAVDLFHAFSKEIVPKVALLSAVETVHPEMTSTTDAACLAKMAEREQITGAIVDGPFAYDNVFSLHAAQTKNIKSTVIGDVDIFVVPNLEAGNILAKQMVLIADALSAGIILGAAVPIILTSRSDNIRSRIASCAVAVMMANAKKTREYNEQYSL